MFGVKSRSFPIASLVWPFAIDSKYFPSKMNVTSMVLVSKKSFP